MPFYDYHCEYCDHYIVDLNRSIKENVSVLKCPVCGELMKQVIGHTIFELRGSGWAKDGYSSSKKTENK